LNLPWATIYDHGEKMANYYGITGIPRAILVDQAGNVVSMMARGPYLERELRKLLGEPLAVADEPEVDAAVEPASDEQEVEAEPAVKE
jgi:thioredoxin-like negative regulator of GroEL